MASLPSFIIVYLFALSFGCTPSINEIHYDNKGADPRKAVEVAAPAGTDLTGYRIVFYYGGKVMFTERQRFLAR